MVPLRLPPLPALPLDASTTTTTAAAAAVVDAEGLAVLNWNGESLWVVSTEVNDVGAQVQLLIYHTNGLFLPSLSKYKPLGNH